MKTLAVDFDGVLHSYVSGWKGATVIPDPPVFGAIEWLWYAAQAFDRVVIFTCRGRWPWGRWAVRAWIRKHAGLLWCDGMGSNGLCDIVVTDRKPNAEVYIDDRAWRFNGPPFPEMASLVTLEPWNKKRKAGGK